MVAADIVRTLRDDGWLKAPQADGFGAAAGGRDLKKCMYFPGTPRAGVRVVKKIARERERAMERMRADNRLDSGWDMLERSEIRAAGAGALAFADEPRAKREWTAHPVLVGLLLLACPPMGLALLWSSPHYSRDARVAITIAMCTMAICATVLLAR